MSINNQKKVKSVTAFEEQLEILIEYFRKEFKLSYAEAIGVMAMQSFKLNEEAMDKEEGSPY